tara:strand:- start:15133 stop:15792 length:660 start_codon:yes stop_codon:yes gene_type:complete
MNEFNEILEIILVEYWFISWPIIILIGLIIHYLDKKKFKKEDVLLNKMGFNRTTESLNLNLPSNTWKGFFNPYKNKNPITSEKHPHILIYLRTESAGESGTYYTRILRLKSKTNKKFPKFFLRKEGILDKFRNDIDYRNNPEFSKKFFLKSLEKEENKLAVEKLFKNFSLQKKLLSNPLNIESNGNEMFYYWERVKFPIEELPKRISEVEFLHDNFFDV